MSDGGLDRRQLLLRGGLVAGAATLAGAGGYVAAREVSGDGDANAAAGTATTAGEGELFALDPAYTNMTTFLLAQHPRPVREAIERHRKELDAGTELYLLKATPEFEEAARGAAAAYLGTGADLVALTDSTTMGLGLVYARMGLQPGDEVLTTEHDFYATHQSLHLREQVDGIAVNKVRLYPLDAPETASADAIVSAIAQGITPKTRAVAVTWVHSSSGVRLPLDRIAEAVNDANEGRSEPEQILLCVDGVHGFGAVDASPVDLGAHIFATGTHKWLFGPRGTGLVWAAAHAWERLVPTIPTFDGQAYAAWLFGGQPDVPAGSLNTPGGFHSFEHRWALKEAFEVHENELGGRAKVAARTTALATRLKQGLAEIDGVTVKTPMDEALSAGLVAVDLAALKARDAVDRLRDDHRIVASVTPYATEYLRFGPSVANTEDDVDRTLDAVRSLA